jgi:hypothetical protein
MEEGTKEEKYYPRPFQMVVQGQLHCTCTRKKGKAGIIARTTGIRNSTRAYRDSSFKGSKENIIVAFLNK